MKVLFLNFLIDLQYVYLISDIDKKTDGFDDSGYSGQDERLWQDHFTIHFINDKESLTFTTNSISPQVQDIIRKKCSNYEMYKKELIMYFKNLHSQLVKEWLGTQSDIKKIE